MLTKLDGRQFELFQNSLKDAFPSYDKLREMVRARLNERLADISPDSPLPQVTQNIIEWAEEQGRLEELISGAITHNSNNPELKKFAIELSLASDEIPTPKGNFEYIVLKNSRFEDVELWREQMAKIERCICRIEIPLGNGRGTGFLVGRDIILTNCHVADIITPQMSSQVAVRFDYKVKPGGVAINEGIVYQLAQDFLVDSSEKTKLDFALLRLSKAAGDEKIESSSKTRGWLTPHTHNFQVNEIQLILQHPLADPLKISAGAVKRVDNFKNRITYTANTESGSSGSPVFNLSWDLVALHHYGQEDGNIGIPLSAIWKQLEDRNLLGELSR